MRLTSAALEAPRRRDRDEDVGNVVRAGGANLALLDELQQQGPATVGVGLVGCVSAQALKGHESKGRHRWGSLVELMGLEEDGGTA